VIKVKFRMVDGSEFEFDSSLSYLELANKIEATKVLALEKLIVNTNNIIYVEKLD